MFKAFRRLLDNSYRIREAINAYPSGICFANDKGVPMLVNPCMDRLCHQLTGFTVLNATKTWNYLNSDLPLKCGTRIKLIPQLLEQSSSSVLIETDDNSAWLFSQEFLTIGKTVITQYTAEDVTETYENSKRLYKANLEVQLYHERQRALLTNIARINEEKERLHAKIRIHDAFGESLIMTQQFLDGKNTDEERLLNEWTEVIDGMMTFSKPDGNEAIISPREELKHVAELIGCNITIIGDDPLEKTPLILLYSAVREALTNAVRHADATALWVKIAQNDRYYLADIWDNGIAKGPVFEGNGLGNLRKKLEQEGASMQITACGHVNIHLKLLRGI